MDSTVVKDRIICIPSRIMEIVAGIVAGVVVGVVLALLCAWLSGFWSLGQSLKGAFPYRAGFRGAGVVPVQGEQGFYWVELQQVGGAGRNVGGYVAALSCEAIGLFADAKRGCGRGDAAVSGVKGGEYLGGGVVHRLPSRQHVVDNFFVGHYLPVSSNPGLLSFVLSPHCSGLLSLRAPGAGLAFRGVPFSAVVL